MTLLAAAGLASAITLAGPPYAGRPLADVLSELRASGLNVIFSDALVTPEMRVRSEPKAREPVQVLRQVLQPFGLEVRRGPKGSWLVVAAPRPGPSPKAAGGGAALPTYQESVEVVSATPQPEPGPAPLDVRPTDVVALAGAGENVFRAVQALPSVFGTDEVDSRLAVRGGGPDQNLTVMDGVEVHNPYRILGLTSAFNPDLVERFELFAGGFDARHGDRLSSLLVVENRLGTSTRGFGGQASLALTDASLSLEGRLPGRDGSSWLVAGRRTYYDLVAEHFVDDELPAFADVQARLRLPLSARGRLTVLALISDEGTRYAEAQNGEDYHIDTDGDNLVLSAAYHHDLSSRGQIRTTVAYTRFRDGVIFEGRIESDARRSNGAGVASRLTDVLWAREVEVGDLSLRTEADWRLSRGRALTAGFELHRLRPGWHFDVGTTRLDNQRNGTRLPFPSGLPGAGLPDLLDSRFEYSRLGAFAQTDQAVGRLRVRLGLRLDRSALNDEASLQPRLAATLKLGRRFSLQAAGGLYAQTPGYEKTFQADDFVDLASGTGLRNERAWQGVLGARFEPSAGVELKLEAFGRWFDRQLVGRLETEAERVARLARYDFPTAWQDEIPSAALVTVEPENTGRGTAFGLDLFAAKKATSSASRLTGWVAYTFGRAERVAWGVRFPFEYDRRHAGSLVGAWRMTRRLELALTARAASGFAYTQALRTRVAEEPDVADGDADGDAEELVPALDLLGQPIFTLDYGDVSNRNHARLPAFFRLDARLTFRPRGPTGRFEVYLDLINLTARDNAGRINAIVSRRPEAERPAVVEERSLGLPFLPSLGVRWRF